MANLVTPGYKSNVLVGEILAPVEERIIEFKGLNKRTVIEDGEMSDMWNMSPDMYPVLKPRKPRGEMDLPDGILRPLHILRRFDKLGIIAIDEPENENDPVSVSFWYDGNKISEVNNLITTSYAVAINNKMCFFNCDMGDAWSLDITIDGVQPGTYRPLDVDYSITNLAVVLSNTDAKIQLPSGHGLKYDDALNIHIDSYTPSGGSATSTSFDISCIIEEVQADTPSVNTDTIVLPRETFIEMTGEGVLNFSITGKIQRKMPENLDMIVEWNNRLWGCSNKDNTIYASKLGDPTNWHYYQGTGLDSFYAEQGTDEAWTGIAEYSGHLIFFKPNSMTRVYGTAPSNFQITATKAYGVEPGSRKSVLTINDTVYYKSAIGIMAYQGGVPVCISEKLLRKFKNVIAGTEGTKYYASVMYSDGTGGALIVYDIDSGMWHKEDAFRFTDACKIGDKIYCISSSENILTCSENLMCSEDLVCSSELVEGKVVIINPDTPTEEPFSWMATFGPFDEYIEEHKIYSKLALRIKAVGEASVKVYISINEGDWELVESYDTVSTKGDYIPIIPRRCDRYAVKIEGTGDCEIKSLTRRIRKGSFGRL